MADPTYVRMYTSRLDGLKEIAVRDAARLADAADALARRLAKGQGDSSDATALAVTAQRIAETLARIEILEEVSYLTTTPDDSKED